MPGRLEGKVALVTGASRGIGEAIARAFAREGAQVVLSARKPEALEAVAASIRETGGDALAVASHAGHADANAALVAAALDRYGQLDVLVNNAGTNPYFGSSLDVDWASWRKTFDVNLRGPFRLCRLVARHLMEREAPGSLISVSSVAGMMGTPNQVAYGATKAALLSMTKTLAVELGPSRIRVNAIAPGLVETRLATALLEDEATHGSILERTAEHRHAQPDELAGAAVFLASDEASYVTGSTLVVDGGWTIS